MSVPSNEVWMVCMVKWTTFPSSTTNWVCIDTASAGAFLTSTQINASGTVNCQHNGVQYATLGANLSAATLYYCKMHYKLGSGANGVSEIEFSTTTTFAGSGALYATKTNGAGTAQAASAELVDFVGTSVCQFDHVRVSATDLGNSFTSWP